MINDTLKPLVFVGTNSNILKFYELATSVGYTVAGIIDDDYYGQGPFHGIPVIGREQDLIDYKERYGSQFQFLCTTNWVPDNYEIAARNRLKRRRQLNMLDSLGFDIATIVGNQAVVSEHARLSPGVVVDDFAMVEPYVEIGPHTLVYAYAVIGHESRIGRNTVIQRYCLVTSLVTVNDDAYLGLRSSVVRSDVTVARGTFLHPNLMLLRSTEPGEIISLAGKDLRKVYQPVAIE
jgi:UDP-N-acetylbacillosamine N-acetyltransferase